MGFNVLKTTIYNLCNWQLSPKRTWNSSKFMEMIAVYVVTMAVVSTSKILCSVCIENVFILLVIGVFRWCTVCAFGISIALCHLPKLILALNFFNGLTSCITVSGSPWHAVKTLNTTSAGTLVMCMIIIFLTSDPYPLAQITFYYSHKIFYRQVWNLIKSRWVTQNQPSSG